MCVVVCIDMHNFVFVQGFVHRGLNKVYLRKRKKMYLHMYIQVVFFYPK